jgi:hypothetical protein
MRSLLTSGRFIDFALLALVVELAIVFVRERSGRSGLRVIDVAGQLAAGGMLLLGLRAALTGADYRWTLMCLTASLPAHLFDLVRRARRARVS